MQFKYFIFNKFKILNILRNNIYYCCEPPFLLEETEGVEIVIFPEEEKEEDLLIFKVEFWFISTKLIFSDISLSFWWWNFPITVNKTIIIITITTIIENIFNLAFLLALKPVWSKNSYFENEILIGFVPKLIFCKAIFLNFFFLQSIIC